ncbi:hypothetical protein [Paraburkholderia rhynchosiae]|uniref:Uncharacterized protein n=1 Tax=Paraburkholderia rhynchosiae TaxID=487049 RepID=A0A2N7W516_9BURK|nr:hypothetical protein [Paraburkholderia rhynchosiae]PMS24490.1 hypothetical protein C0Z16_30690 [Paraburkholderia rhynchosiae]CAB3736123.1 hypothetical protein LMG27174_06271 [Paraburkholderia rhynchosiae]
MQTTLRKGDAPLYGVLAALGLLGAGIRWYLGNNPSNNLMEFVISVSGALFVCLGVTAVGGFVSLAVSEKIGDQQDFFAFLGSVLGAVMFFAWVVTSG